MKTRYAALLCASGFAFGLLSGCASFAERYDQALRDVAAREHRGTGFKPHFNSKGDYTGYTQRVGKDTYRSPQWHTDRRSPV